MKVYAIWKDSMSGADWESRTAYIDKNIPIIKANKLNKDANCPMSGKWVDFEVKEISVERLNEKKVEYKGLVFTINSEDGTKKLVETILSKLTDEEQTVLQKHYQDSYGDN